MSGLQALWVLYVLFAVGCAIGLSAMNPPKNAAQWVWCGGAAIVWPMTLMALVLLRLTR